LIIVAAILGGVALVALLAITLFKRRRR